MITAEIVVAGDGDLVRVGQGAKKIVEIPHVIQHPVASQVAGVDQDVAGGDVQGSV